MPAALIAQLGITHHPGEHDRDRNIEHGDDGQRGENAAGDVALRILGFLGGGGDHIETDECEEHDRGAGQHAVPAVVATATPGQQ